MAEYTSINPAKFINGGEEIFSHRLGKEDDEEATDIGDPKHKHGPCGVGAGDGVRRKHPKQ